MMKTKLQKAGARRARVYATTASTNHAPVPLQKRRLTFGDKWDYAPAPEDHKHIPIAPKHDLFIDGPFIAPKSLRYFDSINPATEEKPTEIAAADERDVDAA